jgi:hypothetical protein
MIDNQPGRCITTCSSPFCRQAESAWRMLELHGSTGLHRLVLVRMLMTDAAILRPGLLSSFSEITCGDQSLGIASFRERRHCVEEAVSKNMRIVCPVRDPDGNDGVETTYIPPRTSLTPRGVSHLGGELQAP